MSAKKELESLIYKMHLSSKGENSGLEWLQKGLLENIEQLKLLREIALIDHARDVASKITPPILGVPETPVEVEATVLAPSPAPVSEQPAEPNVVTGFVAPIKAEDLKGNLEEIFAPEPTPEPTPAPTAAPKKAKKAAENNKE